jgi:hypothetical protein
MCTCISETDKTGKCLDCGEPQGFQSSASPTCSAADGNISLDDVFSWADGIMGALGTEYADRVTAEEERIAWAITNAPR